MSYDPKPTKYPFPESTDGHYLIVKKNDGAVFDKDYPFIDDSPKYKFRANLMRLGVRTLAIPVTYIALGLKVKGRENLKKYKEELSKGVVSVANHVHLFDYLAEMAAFVPRRTRIIVWDKNMRGENKNLIRYNGGIPLPVGDLRATAAMTNAVDDYLKKGGWLHIAAEGSMWEYYMPIRPFKTGAAHFAWKNDVPILPCAFSYREPKGLLKLIYPSGMFTFSIGEPLYPDKSLPKTESVKDLTVRAHQSVCRLAGIEPSENIYPPLFDNCKRVDYY
ncbi:MAG: 1-acyl-sn-glycerol-3-phosphate acyltransferase [Clostridia bacterium]|nr:1-acyl-sn-glycerol-3-phosphate acyltransferase [Clostridia bacterium]